MRPVIILYTDAAEISSEVLAAMPAAGYLPVSGRCERDSGVGHSSRSTCCEMDLITQAALYAIKRTYFWRCPATFGTAGDHADEGCHPMTHPDSCPKPSRTRRRRGRARARVLQVSGGGDLPAIHEGRRSRFQPTQPAPLEGPGAVLAASWNSPRTCGGRVQLDALLKMQER